MKEDISVLVKSFNLEHKIKMHGKEYTTLSIKALDNIFNDNNSYSCRLSKLNKLD